MSKDAPTVDEMALKDFARLVDFWKQQAIENMKRALRAEAMLAMYEGPIG